MNSERLRNVVRAVREGKTDINMSMFFHSCGTPGCAMGHYASRGDLQSTYLGIGWMQRRDDRKWPEDRESDGKCELGMFLDFANHFDISYDECTELFGGYGCSKAKTKKGVADYIEDFITRHETEEVIEELIQSTKEEQHEFVQS